MALCGSDGEVSDLEGSDIVFVYDNEPRNKEIVRRIGDTIEGGGKVVIWPPNVTQKDINDMVLSGHNVVEVVNQNIYQGLQAKLKFTNWKRYDNGTKVKKRDGRIESLDLDKMHLMVQEACEGLAGVSASQVEMTSGIQFYDGITTSEIQEILIKSASDLIDLESPNYQFVAARLLLFSVRKQLYGRRSQLPNLIDHITDLAYRDLYDKDIFNYYSKEEIEKVGGWVDHQRDLLFTYVD